MTMMNPSSAMQPFSVSYTPTWTSAGTTAVSVGNGSLTGRYTSFGPWVSYQLNLTGGSSTYYSAGAWSFTVPFTMTAGFKWSGACFLFQSGVAFDAAVVVATSVTLVQVAAGLGNGNYVNAAYPWTWTTADQCQFNLLYERA